MKKDKIDSAILSGERIGTIKPSTPSSTASLQPGASVTITGIPAAAASNVTFGYPSIYDGSTKC